LMGNTIDPFPQSGVVGKGRLHGWSCR
jgi:hypothetical protein